MRAILAILVLAFAGCVTRWNAKTGEFYSNADNLGIDITAPDGSHLHIESNLHSPVYRANWHGAGILLGEAAGAAIGIKNPNAANAALATLPALTTAYRTTSPTPPPIPAAKAAHP